MQQLALDVSAQPIAPILRAVSTASTPLITEGTGSLTEMILSENSTIHPVQMLPLLAQCNNNTRWLMWLSPLRVINKQWLTKMGLEKAPIVHLDTCVDTQRSLCSKILAAANSHMIIEWQGKLSSKDRNALQNEATSSGTHVILVHRT